MVAYKEVLVVLTVKCSFAVLTCIHSYCNNPLWTTWRRSHFHATEEKSYMCVTMSTSSAVRAVRGMNKSGLPGRLLRNSANCSPKFGEIWVKKAKLLNDANVTEGSLKNGKFWITNQAERRAWVLGTRLQHCWLCKSWSRIEYWLWVK